MSNLQQALSLIKQIAKDIYDRKCTQLSVCRQEISKLLKQHHTGNEQVKISLESLTTLASRAYVLFESSTIEEKRQLIGYVFSNLEIRVANLCYYLRKPFNLFIDLSSNKE